MNWDAIGAIGQIVGAMLVGITLVYLAIQLRQNTSAMKSSTFQAISTSMGSIMEIYAVHPDIAPNLGLIDPELTAGFERSAMSALRSLGARQWWETAKSGFSELFSAWVDQQLATDLPPAMHAGLGLEISDS